VRHEARSDAALVVNMAMGGGEAGAGVCAVEVLIELVEELQTHMASRMLPVPGNDRACIARHVR
jgi:hypothetical protein